jgi:hypothetical protein
MARTLLQTRTDVLTYLGDSASGIWSTAEVDSYIKEGYDDLCLRTGILWKKDAPAGIQPVAGTGTYTLPTDLYKIERMTWNKKRMLPLSAEEAARRDPRYRATQGLPEAYIVEGDGLGTVRYFRVPSATDSLISIEYQRRGATLSLSSTELELPDRYVDYVTWFAMSRALERDGTGQDLELSAFFRDRYLAGLARIKKRKSAAQSARVGSLGGGERLTAPPLPRGPWNYGA